MTDPTLERVLANEAKLQEATLDVFATLGGWNARDLQFAASDYTGNPGNSSIAPPWYQQNQKFGESIPVYRTEVELRLIRDRMRVMAANNEFALCALENRVNYVVGDGFKYSATAKDVSSDRCRKAAARVQAVIDGWVEINDTSTLEADTLWRLDTEGEAFLRCFPDRRGWMHIRFVEPEHVTYLYGDQSDPENSFGVITDADDTETVHAYHVVEDPLAGTWDTKKINADKILHLKANTRRGAKRGLSVFYPVESNLRRCEDLLASMTSVAKARAKIALIRKVTGLTTPTANSLLDKLTSVKATDPTTNETLNIERLRYGTVLTASANTDYQMPSVQLGASDIVEVLQAELRAVASRLQMPEWMFTALADAKYSNAFVVEAPTLKSFRRIQRHLRNGFGLCRYGHRRALLWRQLQLAVDAGLLTPEDLDDVTVGCEAPTLEARDRIQEVERHEKLVQAGFQSKATAQRSLELNCEIENPQIEQEQIGKARPVTDATAVLQIQTAYIGGQLPRPAAAANLRILLGFTEEQAELLLPLDKAVKRTDDGNAPGGGDGSGDNAPGGGGGIPGSDGAPDGAAPAPVDASNGVDTGAGTAGVPAGAAPGAAPQPAAQDPTDQLLMQALGAQEQFRENKSGVFTDAAGHKYRLDNGRRVPLGTPPADAGASDAGAPDAAAPGDAASHPEKGKNPPAGGAHQPRVEIDPDTARDLGDSLGAQLKSKGFRARIIERAQKAVVEVAARAYYFALKHKDTIDSALTVAAAVLDTPSDMQQKLGYNPTTSSGTAAPTTLDPVKANLGVSGHLAAVIASQVIVKARAWLAAQFKGEVAATEAKGDPHALAAAFVAHTVRETHAALGLTPPEIDVKSLADSYRKVKAREQARPPLQFYTLREAGFTGEVTASNGVVYHYVDGKRVAKADHDSHVQAHGKSSPVIKDPDPEHFGHLIHLVGEHYAKGDVSWKVAGKAIDKLLKKYGGDVSKWQALAKQFGLETDKKSQSELLGAIKQHLDTKGTDADKVAAAKGEGANKVVAEQPAAEELTAPEQPTAEEPTAPDQSDGGGFNPETAVKVAADDVTRLRKPDVFRVIDWSPAQHRQAVADYITANRPDLADEVVDVIAELAGTSPAVPTPKAEQPAATEPPAAPETAQPPSDDVTDAATQGDATPDATQPDEPVAENPKGKAWGMRFDEFLKAPREWEFIQTMLGAGADKTPDQIAAQSRLEAAEAKAKAAGLTEYDIQGQNPPLKSGAKRKLVAEVRQARQAEAAAWAANRADGQRSLHRNIIRAALAAGKPVPPEVLADYPDLTTQASDPAADAPAPAAADAPAADAPAADAPAADAPAADAPAADAPAADAKFAPRHPLADKLRDTIIRTKDANAVSDAEIEDLLTQVAALPDDEQRAVTLAAVGRRGRNAKDAMAILRQELTATKQAIATGSDRV